MRLADLSGRIVVLNFWATWCAPCIEEMPDLNRVHREFADRGVLVVGAAADPFEQRKRVRAFARKLDLEFPVWLGASTDQMLALGLGEALPATAILDEHGHVLVRWNRRVEYEELAAEVEDVLKLADIVHDHGPPPSRERSSQRASLVPS